MHFLNIRLCQKR